MIPLPDVFRCLFQTFDGSAVKEFRKFLSSQSVIKKWLITADFCVRDNEKSNSAFAFTVVPYDAYLAEMQEEIRQALPKDIKKTKEISQCGLDLLVNPRRFHFAFIFDHPPDLFSAPNRDARLEVARNSLQQAIDQLAEIERPADQLKRLKRLKQQSLAKGFNVNLLSDLTLLGLLFSFVTLVLQRERENELIGWFPDRDNMTTWEDGVVWDIALESLAGLGEKFSIAMPSRPICVGAPPEGDVEALWFDDLVRLPDYIAGLFASWNFEKNLIDVKPKYKQLATGVAAVATNLAVFKLRYDAAFQASRLVFSPEQ
ncbi:hypothetical protein AZ34_00375 [Hylemonella gracilis str. Niagara R]|uniref:Uncharacterized protein n=1 Tax=Hylemonella gracilis str. Niagara R TaxID=1458275 RepID=A0A016XND5_9BURK|nr:hypothetical protein [Hylemonella gracilis]EYC52733.1 hypothetical protein AZ34_00375 [Hylemonella gracilis str. Niagara R]